MRSGHDQLEGLVVPASCLVRFEIRRVLSRCGMGVVCVAWDRVCGRFVAIKFLRSEIIDHAESNDRLVREATIMGRLSHPGVPGVYDMGVDEEGRAWYAMRLIEGRELRAEIDACRADCPPRIDRHWPDLRRLLKHLIDVAKTVHWAHEAGFLHRDLKPANIFVSRHGESVLLDWGLAGRLHPQHSAAPDQSKRAQEVGSNVVAQEVAQEDALATERVDPERVDGGIRSYPGDSTAAQTGGGHHLSTARNRLNVSAEQPGGSRVDDLCASQDELATVGQFENLSGGDSVSATASHDLDEQNDRADSSHDNRGEVDYLRALDSDLTNHLARLGTPAYMAPEMRDARFQDVDRRTDVFLLGATLYQILVGTPPFSRSARPLQDLRQSLSGKNISGDLIAICLKAMQPAMDRRYADAERFADDLERYLADEAILACRETPGRRIGRQVRRHWRWASAGALLLVLATGFIGLMMVLNQKTKSFELNRDLLESRQLAIEIESERRLRQVEIAGLYRDADAFQRTIAQHDVGWSGLADQQYASLASRTQIDPTLSADLRGNRLQMLLGFDVRGLVPEAATNNGPIQFAPGCFAYNAQHDLLAIGHFKANLYWSLKLVVGSGETQRWDTIASLSLLQGAKDFVSNRPQPGYRAVCFSPDCQYLFAGNRSGELFCWKRDRDVAGGRWAAAGPPKTLLVTEGTIKALAVSPSGDAIFVATDQHWLHRLDLQQLDEDVAVETVVFESGSQNYVRAGRLISKRMKPNLREIHVVGGPAKERLELVLSPCEGEVLDAGSLSVTVNPSLSYTVASPHPNGKRLIASGAKQELFYLDPDSGRVFESLSGGMLSDSLSNLHQAISPDGCWLARAIQWTDGAQLEVWNLISGQLLVTLPLESEIEPCIIFEGDSDRIWVSGDVPQVFQIRSAGNEISGYSRAFADPIRYIAGGVGVLFASVDDDTWTLDVATGTQSQLYSSSFESIATLQQMPNSDRPDVVAAIFGDNRNEIKFYGVGSQGEDLGGGLRKNRVLTLPSTVEAMTFDEQGVLWCAQHGTGIDAYSLVGVGSDGNIISEIKPTQLLDISKDQEPTSIAIMGSQILVGLRSGQVDVFDRVKMRAVSRLLMNTNSRILDIKVRPRSDATETNEPIWVACAQRDASLRLFSVNERGEDNPREVQNFSAGTGSPVSAMDWLDVNTFAYGRANGNFEILDMRAGARSVLQTRFEKALSSIVVSEQNVALHFVGDRAVRYLDKQALLSLAGSELR